MPVGSLVSAVLLASVLGSCALDPEPRTSALEGTVQEAVQGVVGPEGALLPMEVSPVEVDESVSPGSLDAETGEVVEVPVRASWRIPGLDGADREATDVVTLRREADGWERLSPVRLPWGVSDPVSRTSSRCRVVGSREAAAEVDAVHASCERSVPAVVDVWPGWSGAAVIVLSDSALSPGTGARVEGLVTDGLPAPADRMLVDTGAVAALSETGLDVLLRHELVHVAMRATGSSPVPLWFQEGLASHVGYAGVVDDRAAQLDELRRLQTRRDAGLWPGSAPDEVAFDDPMTRGDAYVAARLAVEVLMDSDGRDAVLAVAAGDGGTDETRRPATDEERTRWVLRALDRTPQWLDQAWGRELERRVETGRRSR